MKESKFRKAVFIVIYRKEKDSNNKEKIKYLILKRKKHWIGWEFPKGGVEDNEDLIEAVKREAFEECGQEIFNIKEYDFSGEYFYKKKFRDRKGYIGQTFKLFSGEVKDEKVIFDEKEHSTYKWCSFEEAYETLTHKNQKEALKIVNDFLIKNNL